MRPVDMGTTLRASPAVSDHPHRRPPGLRILIPGYAQWFWRQEERALVFFGSFAVSIAVGIFAWGTWTGLAVLAFAFSTHVCSAVDVVRQSAFPGFGRWAPLLSASGGLGLGIYVPALVTASFVAWPAMEKGPGGGGYLVNHWAYQSRPPVRGERVWMRSSPWGEFRLGEVIAGPGQEVEWSGNRLRVEGASSWVPAPFYSAWRPEQLTFQVPRGHVLVDPNAGTHHEATGHGLVLIPQTQVAGRVWARSYPFWDRRLLTVRGGPSAREQRLWLEFPGKRKRGRDNAL